MSPDNLDVHELAEAIEKQMRFKAFWDSPEYKLAGTLNIFDMSILVFDQNFAELERSISAFQPKTHEELVRWFTDRELRDGHLVELTRCVHNFVASASSLIDHARRFHKKTYGPGNLIPHYQSKVEEIFANDGLSQFIVNLRQYCLHFSAPAISATVNWDVAKNQSTTGVALSRSQLLEYSGWTSGARKFIENSAESLDLGETCSRYHDKVKSFYEWFKAEQRRIHKDVFEYVDRMEKELMSYLTPPDPPVKP